METDKQLTATPNGDESLITANRAHSHRIKDHNHEDHLSYDPTIKVEFVPPVEGTPAALALAANAAIKVSKLDKGLHKFRTLKRPKMKSLNIMKKINKTTKSRRSKKHFSTNFKGKVIDGVHELYTLTAGMMLGIRFSIDQVMRADLPNTTVQRDDFNFEEAVTFPPKGSTTGAHLTPAHSLAHTFEFKTYSPKIFKRLREFFDIDAPSFMQSVCGDYNYLEFISNSKSGQFFFYSHDGKYMLKTQTKEENKFMRRILPNYYKFMQEHPHSLLVRILGMFRVEMYHLRRKVHFVIMTSVFDSPVKINSIYDLKGSLIGREATPKEREGGGVLKDMDLIHDKRKIHLGAKKAGFMHQLVRDCGFLAENHIMDYSLLVGIHDRSTRESAAASDVGSDNGAHKVAAINARPHSNTPFRRSLHVDSITALAITASSTSAAGNHHPFQSPNHNSDERSLASNDDNHHHHHHHAPSNAEAPLTNDERKERAEASPAASLDDREHSVMSGSDARDIRAHMPSPGKDASHRSGPGSEDEYEVEVGESSEEEDEEDVDEGDSDDGRVRSRISGQHTTPTQFSLVSDVEGHSYGNGIAYSKPWTGRADGGINSLIGKARGSEIYFVGVIDILQEYNTVKRAETMIKGLTNDVRQISSVDPHRYAARFVKFMEDNID